MIFEYAVEPEVVASWSSREDYRRFLERFGLDQRRLVSRFPKRWRDMVWARFEQIDGRSFQQKQRMLELLNVLTARMPKRQASFISGWMLEVEKEHSERKFRSIIATDNPREIEGIIPGTDVNHLLDNLPYIPHQKSVERTPDQMAEAIAPILRCCTTAVLVDPNFSADRQRFIQAFDAYFAAICSHRCAPGLPKVEIHTSIGRMLDPGDGRSAEEELRLAEEGILGACYRRLPRIIPQGMKLRVLVWKEKTGGVQLHNRYVLTDIGSVSFNHGLDCYDRQDIKSPEEGRPDDEITCLTEEVHKRRWTHYLGNPAAFDLVAASREIFGTKRMA